jgi:hypothetical protein
MIEAAAAAAAASAPADWGGRARDHTLQVGAPRTGAFARSLPPLPC